MCSQLNVDLPPSLQTSPEIERAIESVCRRNKLDPGEADQFITHARLKLREDDGRLIRSFEGRSTFPTYLAVVLQRMFFRYRSSQKSSPAVEH